MTTVRRSLGRKEKADKRVHREGNRDRDAEVHVEGNDTVRYAPLCPSLSLSLYLCAREGERVLTIGTPWAVVRPLSWRVVRRRSRLETLRLHVSTVPPTCAVKT